MKRPWLLVALMAATVVALLAALLIQGADDGVDVEALLHAAPAAVDAQGTARLTMAVDLENPGLDVSVDGEGAVDFESGAGWFTVELLEQRIEMRTDGQTLYVLPTGEDQWVSAQADDTGSLGSFGTGPSEAIAFVDLLRGEPNDIEDLGEEEIGGASTRHLRVVMDLDRAIAEAGDEASKGALEAMAALAPDDRGIPFDVWIDERDLPVRQRFSGELQGFDLVITVDLTAWGEDLGVAIPPEGEIREVSPAELAQLFGQPPG